MLNIRQLLGRTGEAAAVRYLKRNGYKVLELNFSCSIGEIDIIAEDQGAIVFVEVKTRSSNVYGSPKEAVTKNKQFKISKVALLWLKMKKLSGVKARFDVVSITKNKSSMDIELVKNAFELKY